MLMQARKENFEAGYVGWSDRIDPGRDHQAERRDAEQELSS